MNYRPLLDLFTRRNVFSRSKHNDIIYALNSLLRMDIKRGQSDEVFYSGSNVILQLKDSSASDSSPLSSALYKEVSVQGDYITCHTWDGTIEGSDPIYIAKPVRLRNSLTTETVLSVSHSYTYATGPDSNNKYRFNSSAENIDLELVTPAWIVGEIISAVSVPTGVVDGSSNPINLLMLDSPKWESAPTKLMKITTLTYGAAPGGDYFKAKIINPATDDVTGSEVLVVKPYKQRKSFTSEIIDGVSLTYTPIDDNTRSSTDGVNTQIEKVYPRYFAGDRIFAATCQNGTGLTVGGVPVKLIDLENRVWARRFTQP